MYAWGGEDGDVVDCNPPPGSLLAFALEGVDRPWVAYLNNYDSKKGDMELVSVVLPPGVAPGVAVWGVRQIATAPFSCAPHRIELLDAIGEDGDA